MKPESPGRIGGGARYRLDDGAGEGERRLALAEWLLTRERHPDASRIEPLLARGDTVTINLRQPMPTYLVYFTAFALDDGEVVFRRDIYDRDRVLISALRDQGS